MTLAMDNFRFDVTAWHGHLDFDLLRVVMRVAFAGDKHATHYRVEPATLVKKAEPRQQPQIERPARLIFGWHESMKGGVKLPFKLDYIAAADWAERWLAEQDYGPEPDHDGSNSKGWRVYNEDWGHVDGCGYSFCAVQPDWAMHGK